MPRKKLQRFKELDTFCNVAQVSQKDIKNKLKVFLKNNKPLILELGCGKGEYTIALAEKTPKTKFIGIDIQGERLWFGAKQALTKKLTNVFFLRIQIENLLKYFSSQSINEIWLTFPDPYPKKGQIKKRLTSPRFLEIYKKILKPNGLLHLKTDNKKLFDYTVETVNKFGGLINKDIKTDIDIKSCYEEKYLAENKKIYYLEFTL